MLDVDEHVCVVNSEARSRCTYCFFFNDTATTDIYTLSLHDALPIFHNGQGASVSSTLSHRLGSTRRTQPVGERSEEHTSELQSQSNLVCRLLLEKKKRKHNHKEHELITIRKET